MAPRIQICLVYRQADVMHKGNEQNSHLPSGKIYHLATRANSQPTQRVLLLVQITKGPVRVGGAIQQPRARANGLRIQSDNDGRNRDS